MTKTITADQFLDAFRKQWYEAVEDIPEEINQSYCNDRGVEITIKLEKWDKIYLPPLPISVEKISWECTWKSCFTLFASR